MSADVLQKSLPHAPWLESHTWRLPGVQPLDPETWLVVDDAFADQLALRERLIDERKPEVHALLPCAREAAEECLEEVLAFLTGLPGFVVNKGSVTRPDRKQVDVDRSQPLLTLGRLIQEDICLMLPREGEHILGGAILCFPASWTLSQKIGHPLMRIHKTVPKYDSNVGRRVQRLFDAIRVGHPMWRANAHLEESPELFTPRREDEPHPAKFRTSPYVRSERQTLKRLPQSGAVVFAIHTWMVRVDSLNAEQRSTLNRVFAQYST